MAMKVSPVFVQETLFMTTEKQCHHFHLCNNWFNVLKESFVRLKLPGKK